MSASAIDSENPQSQEPLDSNSNWSLLGFEPFDLWVIGVQLLFLQFAVRVDKFFLNPFVQFIAATGFFVFLFFLGRTKQYSVGYSKINGLHNYLHLATSIGGITGGVFIFAFAAIPFASVLNDLNFPHQHTLAIFIPLLFCSMGVIPYLSYYASAYRKDDEYIQCPRWVHFVGRTFILLAANVALIFFWSLFVKEDELFLRAFFLTLFLGSFYVPIRVQEMFLRPNGPHFRSLIQTIVTIIFVGSIPPLFA